MIEFPPSTADLPRFGLARALIPSGGRYEIVPHTFNVSTTPSVRIGTIESNMRSTFKRFLTSEAKICDYNARVGTGSVEKDIFGLSKTLSQLVDVRFIGGSCLQI